jgi:thiamine-phosphate pyrophosphorylase
LKNLNDIDFYFITDAKLSKKGIFSDVEDAVHAGCGIIQYREKGKNDEEMIEEARKIKELCGNKAFFIVNDRVDIALASDADGVHLGQEDLDVKTARRILGKKLLGVTVHNLDEAHRAADGGADYLGVSPIFPTDTKADAGKPCGVGLIEEITEEIDLPIVAIGGITKENTPRVIRAGAKSVAAISAVLSSGDVEGEVKEFISIIKENIN